MGKFEILIAGDFYPGQNIEETAIKKPENLFDEDITSIFSCADFRIVNLETPLTKAPPEYQILKTGPHLKAEPETINSLKYLNIDLVSLANNHIFDYGLNGLKDTLNIINENNIKCLGANVSIDKANEPYVKKVNEKSIVFLNFAENEWANASENRGGASPLDIISNANQICDAKKSNDIVIVIIHGGHELYHYPSPRMVKQYRFYAEQGASIIIGHHTHCVSGYEIYKGTPIYYSIGNFLFPSNIDFEGWYEGMLVKIILDNDEIESVYIPISQDKNTNQLKVLKDENLLIFKKRLDKINSIISDQQLLKKVWLDLIEERKLQYIMGTMFLNTLFKRMIRKLKLTSWLFKFYNPKFLLNCISCESHRDLLFESIKKIVKN